METQATLLPAPDGDFELSLFKNGVHNVESRVPQGLGHREEPSLLLIQALSSPILRVNVKNNVTSITELQ